MKVLVTGANGFIGRNLVMRLAEQPGIEVLPVTRDTSAGEREQAASAAAFVFHLAGVNRPPAAADFAAGNVGVTQALCDVLARVGSRAPIVHASSRKAVDAGPYGASKLAAEQVLAEFSSRSGNPVAIFRLPNVFGKWSRPNYNSAVATFCHHIARGQPIDIHDPDARLDLAYIDDVVEAFLALLATPPASTGFFEVEPLYSSTVGELAATIRRFHEERMRIGIGRVGTGLERALYATYASFLPVPQFSYPLMKHEDHRGHFAEVLRTVDSGQVSLFTARPGVTRGGHYHHTKIEKFVIVAGEALFRFRDILTGDVLELRTDGATPTVVETIPGWAHEVINTGSGELVALLWANEVFDPDRPDTFARKL